MPPSPISSFRSKQGSPSRTPGAASAFHGSEPLDRDGSFFYLRRKPDKRMSWEDAMPRYEVRNADTYGHAIGILLLDYRGPFIPGDVGNATTYGYPVLFKLVKGLTLDRVLAGDPEC